MTGLMGAGQTCMTSGFSIFLCILHADDHNGVYNQDNILKLCLVTASTNWCVFISGVIRHLWYYQTNIV